MVSAFRVAPIGAAGALIAAPAARTFSCPRRRHSAQRRAAAKRHVAPDDFFTTFMALML